MPVYPKPYPNLSVQAHIEVYKTESGWNVQKIHDPVWYYSIYDKTGYPVILELRSKSTAIKLCKMLSNNQFKEVMSILKNNENKIQNSHDAVITLQKYMNKFYGDD